MFFSFNCVVKHLINLGDKTEVSIIILNENIVILTKNTVRRTQLDRGRC